MTTLPPAKKHYINEPGPVWYLAFRLFFALSGMYAITISSTTIVFADRKYDIPDIRVHEAVHRQQFLTHGWFKVVALYFWYCLKYGYASNPFETEAYKAQDDFYRQYTKVTYGR